MKFEPLLVLALFSAVLARSEVSGEHPPPPPHHMTSESMTHIRGGDAPAAFFVGVEQEVVGGKEHHSTRRELPAVLSSIDQGSTYTCTVHPTMKRPYQDCIYLIHAYCSKTSPIFVSECKCIDMVINVRDQLNSNWKSYINSCGAAFGGSAGKYNTATKQILKNEYYYLADESMVRVPKSVTENIKPIWNYKCS
jgi:hypothetical protein